MAGYEGQCGFQQIKNHIINIVMEIKTGINQLQKECINTRNNLSFDLTPFVKD